MALEPITRQEKIIAGQDLTPITRMEKFLKEFGGSGGGGAQPDWNAAEGEPGHILNRPFGESTEVLFDQWVELVDADGDVGVYTGPFPELLEAANTYNITYNGNVYKCVPLDALSAGYPTFIGNTSVMGGADTGEPFAIVVVEDPDVGGIGTSIMSCAGDTSATIRIEKFVIHTIDPKFLPDGVPCVQQGELVEILPMTEVVADNGSFNIYTKIEGVEVGKSYIVNYNGTEYKCVGQDFAAIPGAVALGNLGAFGGEPTGEPFVFSVVPDAMFEQTGFGAQIVPLYDAEAVSVAVSALSETLHKIDPRLLPDDLVRDVLIVKVATVDTDGNPLTASYTGHDIEGSCLFMNKAVLFSYNGKTLPLIAAIDSGATAEFGNIYFSNGSLLRDYVVIDADGNITTYEMGETVTLNAT